MLTTQKNTATKLIGGYRYGYQGSEADDEVKGGGNSYTTEFRQYDPRLGRWLSVDPLAPKFPAWSVYAAHNDNPIRFIDPDGRAPLDWIKNKDGQYIWDNTVTNETQVHEGQIYIGKEDSDILKDMFGTSTPTASASTSDTGITGIESDENYVAASHTTVNTHLNVNVRANVTYTENGKIFNGIDIVASSDAITHPLPPDKQLGFEVTSFTVNGNNMQKIPKDPSKTYISNGPGGSGPYIYTISAETIYSQYNTSSAITISLEGLYTFGDNNFKLPTAFGMLIDNDTEVSITFPYILNYVPY